MTSFKKTLQNLTEPKLLNGCVQNMRSGVSPQTIPHTLHSQGRQNDFKFKTSVMATPSNQIYIHYILVREDRAQAERLLLELTQQHHLVTGETESFINVCVHCIC